MMFHNIMERHNSFLQINESPGSRKCNADAVEYAIDVRISSKRQFMRMSREG
jgi:hypothetical protein